MTTRKATHTTSFTGTAPSIWCLAMIVGFAVITANTRAAQPKDDAKSDNQLVGTWRLISARYGGQEATFPAGVKMVKHVTPTQFMWASYDNDGKVTRAAGGDYTLSGDVYEETPEYGISDEGDAGVWDQ